MLVPIETQPDLVDRVYESLLDAICSGGWTPGERLTQEAVAARLGVSRQPVLQAFRILQRQGLIVDTPNRKGVLVAPLDAAFVSNLYAVRGALDALAAATAAEAPRPALRAPGARLLRNGRAAIRAGDTGALVEADLAFHRFVYEASGNPLLEQTATVHWHHTRRTMAAYLRITASLDDVWDEHERLLDAIVAGDVESARREAAAHAQASAASLAALLSARSQPLREAVTGTDLPRHVAAGAARAPRPS